MTDPKLGRLAAVDIDTVWENEPAGFTPWLASRENLHILGEALGLRLELEAREEPVGAFRADMVCREAGNGVRVLIENQLGRSDHNHFGQILAYAAGLEAGAVVWLARRFTDEHRAALDWLNRIVGGKVRFFGLEIELWKIDDSRAAPRFNLVAAPEDGGSRPALPVPETPAGRAARSSQGHLDYWRAFLQRFDSAEGPFGGSRKPSDTARMCFATGRHGFLINAATTAQKRHLRVQLCVQGADAKQRFAPLEARRAEIEDELGHALEWEARPQARGCRVSCYLRDTDPDDMADWPRQHAWLAERINDFHRAFARRIREV